MNEVFQKTRELGEALLRSDEYKAVKRAEQNAMANAEASECVGRFIELRGEMEQIMRDNEKDWARVQKLTDEMDECKQKMDTIDELIELDDARSKFSELVNSINSVLHFIVSGEMGSEDCSGNCSTCGGCSARVN